MNVKFIQLAFVACLVIPVVLTSCMDDLVTNEDQFNKETAAIDNYLEDNNLTAEVESDYGLRYIIQEQGTGNFPYTYDSVVVNYSLRLLGRTATLDEGDSVKFKLDELIAGWQILMPYLREGGKIQMYIPSYYGYGSVQIGDIPANSTLVFDAELLHVDHLNYQQQLAYDTAKINEFIDYQDYEVETDSIYGLKYMIISEGSGEKPSASSKVVVSYKGYYIDDEDLSTTLFDAGTQVSFELQELIEAWSILMPYVKEGGRIRMFVPSAYAYGTAKQIGYFPSNANMVFDVTLHSVLD